MYLKFCLSQSSQFSSLVPYLILQIQVTNWCQLFTPKYLCSLPPPLCYYCQIYYISIMFIFISSVQFSHSVVSDSLQPHGPQHSRLPCPSPTPGNLLKLMSIKLVMPSNYLILCHPLLLPSLFPSIRVFSNGLVLHISCPKYYHGKW